MILSDFFMILFHHPSYFFPFFKESIFYEKKCHFRNNPCQLPIFASFGNACAMGAIHSTHKYFFVSGRAYFLFHQSGKHQAYSALFQLFEKSFEQYENPFHQNQFNA